MRRSFGSPLITLSLFFFAGCAHQFNLPANHLDSPETIGIQNRGELELAGLQTGHQLKVDPQLKESELTAFQLNYLLGLAIPLSDRVDLGFRLQANGPLMARLKVQFAGEGMDQGFSAALTGGGGFTLISQSGSAEVSATYYAADGALIAGYRFSPLWLLYTGAACTLYGYTGSIKGGANESFKGHALQPDLFFGARLTKADFFFGFEISRAVATAGNLENTGYYPGAILGFRF